MGTVKSIDVHIDFYSVEDFGTEKKARDFFRILLEQGGPFIPERISQTEPVRGCFNRECLDDAVRLWLEGGKDPEWHYSTPIMINRKPFRVQSMVIWNRGARATFNSLSLWIHQKFLSQKGSVESLLHLGEQLFSFSGALYGYISRTDVEEAQFVPGTLQTRLPGVFWANYFGPLYVDFFGKNTLSCAPCCDRKIYPHGGMLLMTSQSPTTLEVTADRESETKLRTYLNHDAFPDLSKEKKNFHTREELCAGLQHLRVQHATPVFDFSEVRKGFVEKKKTAEEEKDDAIKKFTSIGYVFLGERDNGTLEFKDQQGGILRFKTGPNGSIHHFPFGMPDCLR